MFRSLHMKLVLIMTLLIVSLMTVVGAFLINSVVSFYLHDFYDKMWETFSQDTAFVNDLRSATENETNGAERLADILDSYTGTLGVDGRNRNYYVLDGHTAQILASSDPQSGQVLTITENLSAALNGEDGYHSNVSASYMDVAFPIQRGGQDYIIYIYDTRQTVSDLNSALISLIIRALFFGLVISVLLSFLLSKTMITPIERLTEGAERVAEGDFSHKITVASRDEIGVLTGTFNAMARQLQETLEEVENERNKLGTLFLHMTDGVVAFSRDGGVIHANPAAEEMLGRSIPVGGTVDYDALFRDIVPLDQVLDVADEGYLEGVLARDDRILELLLAPYDRERQGGVLVVIHDVTEQHKTEEMRREFVANVSHELRTPLTNIRSYAETLVDNAGDLPPEMEKRFLGVILNESDRMTHIVQDLLTLSRFDSGHSELKLAPFSFSEAVRDVYNANLMEAQRHNHTVRLQTEPDIPQIVGDRERIVQVMMNVVSNAIKYTPDGGKIHISAGRMGDRVWMEVADNGIGIPAADRPRIFERFYRVDKARSRESGGTGLGLSIAKEIVDRHHGLISLVDRPGPGLTVRIELLVEGPSHETH
ncbi:HAMP domain-containing protein [Pseudoflavonifractor phocaeensis]|nr:ATP-binding protein [Pseudoflavonifractor phocaeensis]MBM6871175.1 HAMP domain-containing protein [Pseudoflavonifractor phocaeensis]